MTPPSRYSQWQSDVAWYIRGPLLVDCIFRIFSPCYQFVLCLLNVECSVQMSSHKLSFASILKIVALEEKVRKLKTDLKRAQDKNKYSEGEVSLEEKDVFLFFPSFLPCFIHLCVASSAFSLIVQHFFLEFVRVFLCSVFNHSNRHLFIKLIFKFQKFLMPIFGWFAFPDPAIFTQHWRTEKSTGPFSRQASQASSRSN